MTPQYEAAEVVAEEVGKLVERLDLVIQCLENLNAMIGKLELAVYKLLP